MLVVIKDPKGNTVAQYSSEMPAPVPAFHRRQSTAAFARGLRSLGDVGGYEGIQQLRDIQQQIGSIIHAR